MRTQTEVDGEEVLAVYTKKACDYLSVSPTAFTFAERKSGIGKTQIKRHFLKEGSRIINRSLCELKLLCSILKRSSSRHLF